MVVRNASLTDLPPELLDHITSFLPSASAVCSLGRTNKALHAFVEEHGFQTFSQTRFPSLHPRTSPDWRNTARTLATLGRAWDRRAFIPRLIEPVGDVVSWPGPKKVENWNRPRGQTMGFTPKLDVHEEIGPRWADRLETLAFSAGAEVCIRTRRRAGGHENVRWDTYRPLSAYEGRDDVTALHLLPQSERWTARGGHRLITGTANADLQLITLPSSSSEDIQRTYFTTQGRPVRSSSILLHGNGGQGKDMLAVNLGDSHVAMYPLVSDVSKIAPLTELDLRPAPVNGHAIKGHKAWSTQFLSPQALAVGIGPNDEPIRVFAVKPAGLEKDPLRKFSLQSDMSYRSDEIAPGGVARKPTSSVYPIVPLPPIMNGASGQEGNVFLSGGYDGIVRLHDLRSRADVEMEYSDQMDDSAIYSLLPRGQQLVLAGAARHNLLKVFDLRLGARCYDYSDLAPPPLRADKTTRVVSETEPNGHHRTSGAYRSSEISDDCKDYSLFLRLPAVTHTGGRGWGASVRRQATQSSIYTLASSSPHSPYVYAGIESAIIELALTGALDKHPDDTFFESMFEANGWAGKDTYRAKEVLNMAMHDHNKMNLSVQRGLSETWRLKDQPLSGGGIEGRDERWRLGL